MKTSDFNYQLPSQLIAQKPLTKRDHSRLLVLDRKNGNIEHKHFYDILDYFRAGDLLVVNNSKVFPARLIGNKEGSGGRVEVFLHRNIRGSLWECIVGGRIKPGLRVIFDQGLEAVLISDNNDGTWQVKFNYSGKSLMEIIFAIGKTPLPPYIKRDYSKTNRADQSRYQTVYAQDNQTGSVAAPTAGLHFTPQLMKKIKARGVDLVELTLHVGLGTFAPVKVNDVKKHKMHQEWIEIKKGAIQKLIKAKQEGRRVIAVGTTSVRSLETLFADKNNLENKNFGAWTDIFIYPGYKFRAVDALITNFHLPQSTLLMLVSALAGKDNILRAYNTAVRKKYRFFSYGDAMFIQ